MLPDFDFSAVSRIPFEVLLERSVELLRRSVEESGLPALLDYPPVPPQGASEAELSALEAELGVALPLQYRALLWRWRYLVLGTGLSIWGLPHNGLVIGGGSPWVSEEHFPRKRFLVCGNYWRYADGDELFIDLSAPNNPVYVYLHEALQIEPFAPSVALALWRIAEENEGTEAA